MVQLRQATARLRLMLADIVAREEELDTMVAQFQTQMDRLAKQASYGSTTIDIVLSAMAEIEERLNDSKATRGHLLIVKRKASEELNALELTRQVEEAKEALSVLKARMEGQQVDEPSVAEELKQLEQFIAEYSKKAERTITLSPQDIQLPGKET